jgi:hypothetical protein
MIAIPWIGRQIITDNTVPSFATNFTLIKALYIFSSSVVEFQYVGKGRK